MDSLYWFFFLTIVPFGNCFMWNAPQSFFMFIWLLPLPSIAVPTVTDATWQSLVLKAEGPVLVEFWASWCGPCRVIHPVISELAKEYAGKLKCFKLNTDDSPSTAKLYGIRSIPTTMIFINGEKREAIIGALPKATLSSSIEKFL